MPREHLRVVRTAPVTPGKRTLAGLFRPYFRRFLHGSAWLLATNACALWIPRLLNESVERLRAGAGWRALVPAAVTMALVALVGAATRVMSRVVLFNVGRDVEFDVRADFYASLARQPPEFFERHATGDLMSRATNDLTNVRLLYGYALLNVVNTVAVFAGNVPLLVGLDATLAAACLLPYPVVLLSTRGLAHRVFTLTRTNQEHLALVGSRVQEFLAGQSVVRAFAQEKAEQARFLDVNQTFYASSVRLAMARNLFGPVMGLLGTTSALVALWYGAVRVMDGKLSVGGIVEFSARLAALAWPTLALGWMMAVWQRGAASLERLNGVLAAVPSITDPPHVTTTVSPGEVALEHVGVERGGRTSLRDVDLRVAANGFVGIVGATGSGKTTLALLVPRLLDATAGRVLVGGVDVRERTLAGLRAEVAVAPQEAFLFSTSLLENIRFGHPSTTRDDVDRLVDLLALRQDVRSFPHGLDTVVGEKGITLSGGQRQRVALARALLCDPRVLVLDDTVSALDAETQEQILTALRGEAHRRTLVITSHRLSAVRDADEIMVLERGLVVERGVHTDLLRRGGAYAALWGREKALEELARVDRSLGGAA